MSINDVIFYLQEAKESEIVGLKLKLNAHDDMSSSQRNTVQEITERLAEVQRELQRCKTSLQDSNNTIEVLQRDLRETEESLAQANARVDTAVKQSMLDKEKYAQELNVQKEKQVTFQYFYCIIIIANEILT